MVFVLVSTDHPANRTGSQPFERFEANRDVLCRRGIHQKHSILRDESAHIGRALSRFQVVKSFGYLLEARKRRGG